MCMGEITDPSRQLLKTHPGLFSIMFCKRAACVCTSTRTFLTADTRWHSSERRPREIQRTSVGRHRTVQHLAAAGREGTAVCPVVWALWHEVRPVRRRFCYLLFLGSAFFPLRKHRGGLGFVHTRSHHLPVVDTDLVSCSAHSFQTCL